MGDGGHIFYRVGIYGCQSSQNDFKSIWGVLPIRSHGKFGAGLRCPPFPRSSRRAGLCRRPDFAVGHLSPGTDLPVGHLPALRSGATSHLPPASNLQLLGQLNIYRRWSAGDDNDRRRTIGDNYYGRVGKDHGWRQWRLRWRQPASRGQKRGVFQLQRTGHLALDYRPEAIQCSLAGDGFDFVHV